MARLISRRRAVAGLAAAAGLFAPAVLRAQSGPLTLGVLTPLTGAGGLDGPRMLKAMQAVGAEVNAAGGVIGRQIEFIVEDDQTNPEAAVRAARKLIDVSKVPVIMGTWASAVTSAVAPVCWESKTFLTTVSGADSITLLPHQGYLIRTQPNNHLQAAKHAQFIGSLGAKRVFCLSIQAPFSLPTQERLREVLPQHGSALIGALIYVLGSPDRHQHMSEQEFEAEVKRGSPLGAAFMGVEKVLRPHQIEQVLNQKHKIEKGVSVAGDPPTTGNNERDSS